MKHEGGYTIFWLPPVPFTWHRPGQEPSNYSVKAAERRKVHNKTTLYPGIVHVRTGREWLDGPLDRKLPVDIPAEAIADDLVNDYINCAQFIGEGARPGVWWEDGIKKPTQCSKDIYKEMFRQNFRWAVNVVKEADKAYARQGNSGYAINPLMIACAKLIEVEREWLGQDVPDIVLPEEINDDVLQDVQP